MKFSRKDIVNDMFSTQETGKILTLLKFRIIFLITLDADIIPRQVFSLVLSIHEYVFCGLVPKVNT